MYAAIRKYRVIDLAAFTEKVEEEFVQRVEAVEGFAGYYVVDGGDGSATAITVAETKQAVEASVELARAWIVERAAHLVEAGPEVTVGEVCVRVEPRPSPA